MRGLGVPLRAERRSLVPAGTAGVFDVTANALHLAAARTGVLSVAASDHRAGLAAAALVLTAGRS